MTMPCCPFTCVPGCDKNMPGTLIAMARLNRPSIMVYGGTIKPGYSKLDGGVLDIVSAFQCYGELWLHTSVHTHTHTHTHTACMFHHSTHHVHMRRL